MKVKILGTRGEVEPKAPYHSKHSGVLVDDMILLDLGEREFLDYQPKCVFITHLHPDHAFFVLEPISNSIPVYAPELTRNADVTPITDMVSVNSYKVTPVPTHHSKKVKSTAYVIDNGKHRLLYTGDVIWIDREYHHLLHDLSLVITDGSYIRKGGMIRKDRETGQLYGHAGISNLIALFSQFTRHIALAHFGSWFYKDVREARTKLMQMGKDSGVTIHVGHDGMELDLDKLLG